MLVIEFIEDDIDKDKFAVINDCEVITVGDPVLPDAGLLKDVDIGLLFVVCVLSLFAKIKEKRSVNIVISHNISITLVINPCTSWLNIILQWC